MPEEYLPTTIHLNCDPRTATNVTEFLSRHLGQCDEPGCTNTVLFVEQYRCFFCSTAARNIYYCLARHAQYVNLTERYGRDFQVGMWHPDVCYMCYKCIAATDVEYALWQQDGYYTEEKEFLQQSDSMWPKGD